MGGQFKIGALFKLSQKLYRHVLSVLLQSREAACGRCCGWWRPIDNLLAEVEERRPEIRFLTLTRWGDLSVGRFALLLSQLLVLAGVRLFCCVGCILGGGATSY